MEFRILGPLEVWHEGRSVPLRGVKVLDLHAETEAPGDVGRCGALCQVLGGDAEAEALGDVSRCPGVEVLERHAQAEALADALRLPGAVELSGDWREAVTTT